jgi:hypothetical protein
MGTVEFNGLLVPQRKNLGIGGWMYRGVSQSKVYYKQAKTKESTLSEKIMEGQLNQSINLNFQDVRGFIMIA